MYIIALASNPIEQIKSELPGCITDDFLIIVESYYKDFLTVNSINLAKKQLFLLSEIDKNSDNMSTDPLFISCEEEIEESDLKKILESDEWNTIRRISREFLDSMNWDLKELSQFKQTGENVCRKE
ncbi:hypothetical protein [Bacillus sp. EAC]|uniref:hypothetical protein n=1 Tax=Bacillus sp. EAC TaxID=1978338 RepID=UPI000B44A164|nr:hypothetical protein [Bacillus sp. EAC]